MKVPLLINYIIVNNIEINFLKSCCIEKKQKIAAIDIGSHNCRLMVVEKSAVKKNYF